MLYYSNIQVIFNFELGKEQRYIGNTCAFCNIQDAQSFFPNLEIKNGPILTSNTTLGEIYTLSAEQMLNFIKDWESNSKFHKLINWCARDWFDSYLYTVKKAINVLDGDIGRDEPVFSALEKEIANHKEIDYNSNDRYLIPDSDSLPEFSWALEDCLWCRIYHKKSPYEDYVNHILNKRIQVESEYCNRKHLFDSNFSKVVPEKVNICNIDLFTDKLWNIISSSYREEAIVTNVKHVKRIIEIANERLQ